MVNIRRFSLSLQTNGECSHVSASPLQNSGEYSKVLFVCLFVCLCVFVCCFVLPNETVHIRRSSLTHYQQFVNIRRFSLSHYKRVMHSRRFSFPYFKKVVNIRRFSLVHYQEVVMIRRFSLSLHKSGEYSKVLFVCLFVCLLFCVFVIFTKQKNSGYSKVCANPLPSI